MNMRHPRTVRNRENRTVVEKERAAKLSVSEPDYKRGSTAQPAINRSSAGESIQIADRIKELRRVRARDLLPNPKNWRRHPKAQVDALRDLLAEVGYADALLVRELPDGRLMLLDGHLRAETTPDAQVPVLVLDVSEELIVTHKYRCGALGDLWRRG